MPFTLDRALNSTGGTAFDLAMKQYSGEVITAFRQATVAWDIIRKKQLTGAKGEQFPALWKLSAGSHTPGTDIDGQTLDKEGRWVYLEDEETIAYGHSTVVDQFIQHYDHRSQLAQAAGPALAHLCDSHVFQQLILTGRMAARGNFPGGQTLTTKRVGPITTAYPLSAAGSANLQSDLGEIAQKMTEDNVPKEDRYAFLSPYLIRVLRQDNTLLSRDYTDQALADKLSGKLLKVENLWILETNNYPSADLSEATTPVINNEVAYAGDFSKAVCSVMHMTALGGVYAEGISPTMDWLPSKRVWLVGAAMLKGLGWLRPEACGQIDLA